MTGHTSLLLKLKFCISTLLIQMHTRMPTPTHPHPHLHPHPHPHTETSMVQSTLTSHQGWVVAVNWSPDNEHQLLSGSYDSTVRLWDTRSPKVPLFTITAHEGKVLCLDWSLPKVGWTIEDV